jgi:dolichyl-phosphate beta-glucosyltransferase
MTQLSIVIPAHNEALRLGATLERVVQFLCARQRGQSSQLAAPQEPTPSQETTASRKNAAAPVSPEWEIVVVDDVSEDETYAVADRFRKKGFPVRVIRRTKRPGKGAAVGEGILAAAGRTIIFSDADLSTPIEEADKLIARLNRGYDVAIASRLLPESQVERPGYREVISRLFSLVVRALALPGIADSQCGFKAFRSEAARELFSRRTIHGWAFDVEILYLARKLHFRVKEVPVRWVHSPRSRLRPARSAFSMVRDVLRVRLQDLLGVYRRQITPARGQNPS